MALHVALLLATISASPADAANVRDFGARGDGSDDTAAIQRAIATGRSLYYPGGTYGIRATLGIRPGTTWRGDGGNSILRALPGFVGEALVHDERATSLSMRDLALDANHVAPHGIKTTLSNTNNYILQNLEVRGARSHGIYAVKAIGASFISVKSDHNGGDGFRLEDSNLATLINCRAVSNLGNGLLVRKGPNGFSSGVRIFGGQFEANRDNGIHLVNSSSLTVASGAWIEANANDGVRVASDGGPVPVAIRDCNIYLSANPDATNWAVHLGPNAQGTVASNYLFNSGGHRNFIYDETGGKVDTSGNRNGNGAEAQPTRFPSGSALVLRSADYQYDAVKLWVAPRRDTWVPILAVGCTSDVHVEIVGVSSTSRSAAFSASVRYPSPTDQVQTNVRWKEDTLELRQPSGVQHILVRVSATVPGRDCVPAWLQ